MEKPYHRQLEDRVAELEAENAKLRAALAPFAKVGNQYHDDLQKCTRLGIQIESAHWLAAAEAMEGNPS